MFSTPLFKNFANTGKAGIAAAVVLCFFDLFFVIVEFLKPCKYWSALSAGLLFSFNSEIQERLQVISIIFINLL